MEMSEAKSISLGNRLEACAELVRRGKVAADIGTDHAYLPIWLVQNGIVPTAYASDINEEPVRLAKSNIKAYGLDEKINTFTADGLEKIPPSEVDDIIIAGMGGDNIAAILSKAEWLKNADYRLILQPMTSSSRLREYLFGNGFEIISEKAVCEAGRIYTVICAQYSEKSTPYDDYDIYAGRLDSKEPYGAAFLKKQAGILSAVAEGFAAKGDYAEQIRYKTLAEKILLNVEGKSI